MKSTTLKSAILSVIIVMGMTNCNNSAKQKAEKLENAQENLNVAEQALQQAVIDSTNEFTRYKMESEAKLKANDQKIAELKATMQAEKADIKVKYENQMIELEKKNQALKVSITDYKESDVNKWEKFKESFNRDLDSLGKAISRISIKK
ncbi:MAG: hypothetical protein Q7U47_04395 [Paludibacter sp.]|nr:hypothetical protein [Paludibacter sp.]